MVAVNHISLVKEKGLKRMGYAFIGRSQEIGNTRVASLKRDGLKGYLLEQDATASTICSNRGATGDAYEEEKVGTNDFAY